MCSSHRPHRVCMVGLYATGRCVLVRLVMGDFGQVSFPWHCWVGLVVDHLPAVNYWLGFGVDYSDPALVDYWGLAGWDGYVVQTPVPMERVEQGWGLEPVALVVHNKFGWVAVPQMWAFSPRILCLPHQILSLLRW